MEGGEQGVGLPAAELRLQSNDPGAVSSPFRRLPTSTRAASRLFVR